MKSMKFLGFQPPLRKNFCDIRILRSYFSANPSTRYEVPKMDFIVTHIKTHKKNVAKTKQPEIPMLTTNTKTIPPSVIYGTFNSIGGFYKDQPNHCSANGA